MRFPKGAFAGKLAFLAVNLGVAGLAVVGVLLPAFALIAERTAALSERGDVLSRMEQIAAAEGQAALYANQVRERNARGGLIEGGNEGAASAGLQSRLKAAAEAHGGVVRSLSGLPSRASGQGGGQMIGARLEYAGTLEAVTRTIHAIENGPALLVVTAASLRPRREASRERAEAPQVDVQLDVYGGFKEARP